MEANKRRALLVDVHEAIHEASSRLVRQLQGEDTDLDVAYPPKDEQDHGDLSEKERAAVQDLELSEDAASAIRKLSADAISSAFFRFFGLVDAVGDPEGFEGDWLPLTITDTPEDSDELMWHDDLFDSYWAWREKNGANPADRRLGALHETADVSGSSAQFSVDVESKVGHFISPSLSSAVELQIRVARRSFFSISFLSVRHRRCFGAITPNKRAAP